MPGGLLAVIILIAATLAVGALAIYANVVHCPRAGRRPRLEHTEPPHADGPLLDHAGGTYTCVCCGNKLFFSAAKVKEGPGAPCFRKPLTGAVIEITDISGGQVRTDVMCSRCQTHLGYLSSRSGGYFINPTSLEFVS